MAGPIKDSGNAHVDRTGSAECSTFYIQSSSRAAGQQGPYSTTYVEAGAAEPGTS